MKILCERPDIIVIQHIDNKRLPICVVEVKKPGKDGNSKREDWDKWVGQLYDYMFLSPYIFSTRFAFGILTTYEAWQFFWFADTDNVAEADSFLSENMFSDF